MSSKSKFHRAFMIFSQEDTGYGYGQQPSGYVKIEVRDGKGKLSASVQNLKDENNKQVYRLYMLKAVNSAVIPVCAGTVGISRNRGELLWEFNPDNVAGTGVPIEEFEIAALLLESTNSKNSQVICPLAAYKGQKPVWREATRKALYAEVERPVDAASSKELIKEKSNVSSKYTVSLESKYEIERYKKDADLPRELHETDDTKAQLQPDKEHGDRQSNSGGNAAECQSITENGEEVEDIQKHQSGNASSQEESSAYERIDPQKEGVVSLEKGIAEKVEQKQDNRSGQECSLNSNGFCGPQQGIKGYKPCDGCNMIGGLMENGPSLKGSSGVEQLKACFDQYFERYDPFGSKRRDYRWWKVSSPVYLNNIFYQCSVKTPLLFNPAVMMSHFKYRHLIVGIYSEKIKKREFIVCGIPGAYSIDDKPFGELCRWVQLEGLKPKYGAFGYWLVYIDPTTGKILKLG